MRNVIAIFVMVLSAAGILFAGLSSSVATTVIKNSDGSGKAYGVLSQTRNSADTVDYIGCSGQHTSTGFSVGCDAKNTNGDVLYGYSTDTAVYNVYKSIHSDSFVRFEVDSSGKITKLYTANR
ncbi:MAG: hypothetical protein GY754_43220 [bacterium]|nr:hypothetical protein [bacterium]